MNEPIGIDQAVSEICSVNDPSAFFFIVGAGVSAGTIPTASRMIEDWRAELAGRRPPVSPPATLKPGLDEYQFWFGKARTQPKQRQEYLRSKIRSRAVPRAAFALAKILADGRLGRLVVTTNFDMFIARALTYLGVEPLVYDYPDSAMERFTSDPGEVQVLHVHGTYLYYDCANLAAEINGRTVTMVRLMHLILSEQSPLILGYSGWEGDVIMTGLRDRLYKTNPATIPQTEWQVYSKPLPYNLYWFCYREADLQPLPAWLKEHPNVFFVLPTRISAEAQAANGALMSLRSSTALSQAVEPALPADEVFGRIVSTLNIADSEVELDPVTFFVSRLQGLIPGLGPGEVSLLSEYAKQILPTRIKLDQIRKLLDHYSYAEALQVARELVAELKRQDDWDPTGTCELMEALWKAAYEQQSGTPEVLGAYDDIIALGHCIRDEVDQPVAVDERVAKAWASKGLALLDQERYDPAIVAFDALIEQYAPGATVALQDTVASSKVNKGIALYRKLRPKQPGDAADTILHFYDTVLATYGGASECTLRETIASAKVNKAFLLGAIGNEAASEALYDEVITGYADASEPTLREHVARAMINRAFRFGEKHVIEQTHRAQDLYRQVTLKFSGAPRPSIQTKIALAWNGLGFQSLLLAKYYRTDAARSTGYLQEGMDAITKAKELKPGSGMILGNEAYIHFLLGDHDKSRETLAEALRLGGEDTRQGELRDVTIYPIPEDAVFAEWARTMPAAVATAA